MTKYLELTTINVFFNDDTILQIVGHDLEHSCCGGKHIIKLVIDEQNKPYNKRMTYTFLDEDVKEITQYWTKIDVKENK